MTRVLRGAAVVLLAAGLCGCAGYSWRSEVPEEYRTVSVPTFRNESELTQVGSVMTRQLLREFQREGTFAVRRAGEAALEVQGLVQSVSAATRGYDRRSGLRMSSGLAKAVVRVSVVDKRRGAVLIDGRVYRPEATYLACDDYDAAMRDASGRLAEDLARMVVDDVVALKFRPAAAGGKGDAK